MEPRTKHNNNITKGRKIRHKAIHFFHNLTCLPPINKKNKGKGNLQLFCFFFFLTFFSIISSFKLMISEYYQVPSNTGDIHFKMLNRQHKSQVLLLNGGISPLVAVQFPGEV